MSNLAVALEIPAPAICRAKARRVLGKAPQTPMPTATPEIDHHALHKALDHLEQATQLLLSIHEYLFQENKDLARIAWVAYVAASQGTEGLGDYLGVDVSVS